MLTTSDWEAARVLLEGLRARGDDRVAAVVERLIAAAQESAVRSTVLRPPDLLTTGQAARALGVSVQTIKNWAAAGKLRTTRLGGRTMVDREGLLAYLDGLRTARASDLAGPRRETEDEATQRAFIQAAFPPNLIERLRELVDAMEDRSLSPDEAAELERLEAESARISAERLRQWIQARRATMVPGA
jgi:excisionase family DNA binding protein